MFNTYMHIHAFAQSCSFLLTRAKVLLPRPWKATSRRTTLGAMVLANGVVLQLEYV